MLPPAGPKVEACALVSTQDVAAIQQAPITDARTNEVPTVEFVTSQCYYNSSEPNCSVTIAIVQREPANGVTRSIHQYWEETFARFREGGDEKEEEEERADSDAGAPTAKGDGEAEEERERQHAQKVEGVGEETFWSTNAVGGILYSLQGEKIIRISVGGPSGPEEKREKSKTLARKVIAALAK